MTEFAVMEIMVILGFTGCRVAREVVTMLVAVGICFDVGLNSLCQHSVALVLYKGEPSTFCLSLSLENRLPALSARRLQGSWPVILSRFAAFRGTGTLVFPGVGNTALLLELVPSTFYCIRGKLGGFGDSCRIGGQREK